MIEVRCPNCKLKFNPKYQFTRDEKLIICPYCGKEFKKEAGVER